MQCAFNFGNHLLSSIDLIDSTSLVFGQNGKFRSRAYIHIHIHFATLWLSTNLGMWTGFLDVDRPILAAAAVTTISERLTAITVPQVIYT